MATWNPWTAPDIGYWLRPNLQYKQELRRRGVKIFGDSREFAFLDRFERWIDVEIRDQEGKVLIGGDEFPFWEGFDFILRTAWRLSTKQ